MLKYKIYVLRSLGRKIFLTAYRLGIKLSIPILPWAFIFCIIALKAKTKCVYCKTCPRFQAHAIKQRVYALQLFPHDCRDQLAVFLFPEVIKSSLLRFLSLCLIFHGSKLSSSIVCCLSVYAGRVCVTANILLLPGNYSLFYM